MAFDLNKNDGSVMTTSKFDLSKEQQVVSPAPKSKNWLFGLLGFIIALSAKIRKPLIFKGLFLATVTHLSLARFGKH